MVELDLIAEVAKGLIALALGFAGGLFQGRLKDRRDARTGAELEAIKFARQAIEEFEDLIRQINLSDAQANAALHERNGGILPVAELQELHVHLTIVERILIRNSTSGAAPVRRRAILQSGKLKVDLVHFHILIGCSNEELRASINTPLPADATSNIVAARRMVTAALESPEQVRTEQIRSLRRLRVALLTVEYAIRHAVPWADLEGVVPDEDDLQIGWSPGPQPS